MKLKKSAHRNTKHSGANQEFWHLRALSKLFHKRDHASYRTSVEAKATRQPWAFWKYIHSGSSKSKQSLVCLILEAIRLHGWPTALLLSFLLFWGLAVVVKGQRPLSPGRYLSLFPTEWIHRVKHHQVATAFAFFWARWYFCGHSKKIGKYIRTCVHLNV